MTDFVPWYSLQEIEENSPEKSGVYQIRILKGLLDYTSGKSAMVCYGQSTNLKFALQDIAMQHQDGHFLCRHQCTQTPAVLLAFVVTQFERRFGTVPTWPESKRDELKKYS